MTAPSKFSAKGLSILVSVPLIQGDDVIGEYSAEVNDYTHTISANGGFTSADFTISGNNEFIENWLQFGLGRHIKVFGPAQQIIWEGFVNEVTGNLGYATFSRGPLTNIANRLGAWYTYVGRRCYPVGHPLYDVNCEETGEYITGTQLPLPEIENLDSQEKYGIWEKIINIGDAATDEAEYAQGLYLAENAYPEWNPSLSLSGNAGDLSVKISCKGYYELLDNYVYSDLTDGQWVYISELIKTILGDEPNDIISTDYSFIKDNLVVVLSQITEEKSAKTLIDNFLTYGGGNDDLWTFGIYKDRKVTYSPIPTGLEYIYYKTGKTQQVETPSGQVIEPWDALPCKWAAIPTFLASFPFKLENLRDDPRIFFVEEVTFTAPDQINLSGAKIRKFSQYLAKLGLYGA